MEQKRGTKDKRCIFFERECIFIYTPRDIDICIKRNVFQLGNVNFSSLVISSIDLFIISFILSLKERKKDKISWSLHARLFKHKESSETRISQRVLKRVNVKTLLFFLTQFRN